MRKAKIGVQAMMLKEKFSELGAYETLKKIAELGYHCIELSQIPMTDENIKGIKRASEDFDIEIAALSAAIEPTENKFQDALTTDFDKIVKDCKTLNCKFVRIGMLPYECMVSTEKALDFCKKAKEMAKKLEDNDIKLYYHNHHVEFQKYDGKYLLDIIKENTDNIGFELDVYWIQRGGANPIDIIKEYTGKVSLLHLKDYRIGHFPKELLDNGDYEGFHKHFENCVQFAEVGEGNLDMKKIIDTGLEAGAKYLLIEQDKTYGIDPFQCLAISANNLKKLGYANLF